MSVAILGAGAIGTALAIALARGGTQVTLWAHDPDHAATLQTSRENTRRLPGPKLPDSINATGDIADTTNVDTILAAVPMQALGDTLATHKAVLHGKPIVACCKGIDLATGRGPSTIIQDTIPSATPALLSGPSFATDIATGLPTALTLAAPDEATATDLQQQLSTDTLRVYRTTDLTGVELGGALKNVIAIACGITIGTGLGESARAALMTRGYAEMLRFATAHGAKPETLAGLSGFGDLALTCTSTKSRNFSFGLALGQRGHAEPTATTEGIATALAVARKARVQSLQMPITTTMAAVLNGDLTVQDATRTLMTRPLTTE